MLSQFAYSGIDSAGREIKGLISSPDKTDALSQLRNRGLTVVELTERRSKEKKSFSLKKGFRDEDVYNLSRELSILLRSGIRIDHAVDLLMNSATKQ